MSSDAIPSSSSRNSRKPKYSRFTQQELPACKPILTPGLVIITFIALGIIFIPIGLTCLSASTNVTELVDRYDDACLPSTTDLLQSNNERVGYIQNPSTNKTCVRTFIVPKKMKKPIFVYYQLDGFYQNHRRYVKSRNDHQLRSPKDEHSVKSCEPEAFDANNKPIVPCGLIAWSLFNDTYKFSRNNAALDINRKDIAWNSDKTKKFSSNVYPKNFQSGGLIGGGKLDETKPLSEQEDLIVWMRPAALPSFRKLYGRIETDLEPNDKVDIVIQNNYNTYSFNGEKKIVISTTTWIGGKNDFLGRTYTTVGGTSLLLAICFSLVYIVKPRPLGDPAYLSWNKNPTPE